MTYCDFYFVVSLSFRFSAIEKSSFTHYNYHFSDSHEKELLSLEITHCLVSQGTRQDW